MNVIKLSCLTDAVNKSVSASEKSIPDVFKLGSKALIPAAMFVGTTKGIDIIFGGDHTSEPSMPNTVLYYAGQFLAELLQTISAVCTFHFQSGFIFLLLQDQVKTHSLCQLWHLCPILSVYNVK